RGAVPLAAASFRTGRAYATAYPADARAVPLAALDALDARGTAAMALPAGHPLRLGRRAQPAGFAAAELAAAGGQPRRAAECAMGLVPALWPLPEPRRAEHA